MTKKLVSSLKLLLIISFLIFLNTLLTSCDSFLTVDGIIYDWVNAPSNEQGQIYIQTEPPKGLSLRPVTGATISYYFKNIPPMGPSCSSASEREKWILKRDGELTSNSEGIFHGFWAVAGNNFPWKVVINKEGYYQIEKEFIYDWETTEEYNFIILLIQKR
jgi:hypothetical protein